MKILIILLSLFAFSCAKNEFKMSDIPNYDYYKSSNPKARIYLAHGFGGNKDTYKNEPFKSWIQDLNLKGYDVVAYNLPSLDLLKASSFLYRHEFKRTMIILFSNVESSYGHLPSITGGVSFGGLHAMMSKILLPNYFDSYFAHLPVTDFTALDELKTFDSTYFNPLNEYKDLIDKNGLIIYGNIDERVNFRLTIDLITRINTTSYIELPIGHTST